MLKNIQKSQNEQERKSHQYLRDYKIVQNRKLSRQLQFSKRRIRFSDRLTGQSTQRSLDRKQFVKRVLDLGLQNLLNQLLQKKYSSDMIPLLAGYVKSNQIELILQGIIGIESILSQADVYINQVLQLGVVEYLVEYVKLESPQLQLETAICLSSLALGNQQQCNKMYQLGMAGAFFHLLSSDYIEIVEYANWGLCNFCLDLNEARDYVLINSGINLLIKNISKFKSQARFGERVCWVISSLCLGDPKPQYDLVYPGIVLLCCMIKSKGIKEQEILTSCLYAISTQCQRAETVDKSKAILQTSLIPEIIKNLNTKNTRLLFATLRVIGNFSTGDDTVSNELFSCNILELIYQGLCHPIASIRRQYCWILSNISAGQQEYALMVIKDRRLMQKLMQLLQIDAPFVKKQILFVFSNMSASLGNYQIENFYRNYEIINYFVEIMKRDQVEFIQVALENLYCILKRSQKRGRQVIITDQLFRNGGVQVIQQLQYHPTDKIYCFASKILRKFFQCDETIREYKQI